VEKIPIWALNPPRKAIFLHKNEKKVQKSLQIRELMPIFAPKNVAPCMWKCRVACEIARKMDVKQLYKIA
jgi:hypothetical protein